MSDVNSKLIKYKSLNIISHLNDTFPTYEKSVVLMEKDKISLIKTNIENEIFKVFIQNSDSLLDILYAYETVYTRLTELKDITYHTSFEYENVTYVDKKKLLDFRGVIQKFTTDISSFDTGERVLEHFEFLGEYIFLMTNDILIIGKKLDRKYSLINTFNYSVIDLLISDKLTIKMGQTEIVYEGEKSKIIKIWEKFRELSYNYEDSVSSENDNTVDNEDLRNYFIETEKYDELIDNNLPFKVGECGDFYDLSTLNKCTEKNPELLITFLKYKFKESLYKISKVKRLAELIEEVFEFFYKFHEEEKEIYKEDNIKTLLLIEDHIIACFKYFEKRIFNRRFYCNTLEDILNLLKVKLVFQTYDYSYMVDYFLNKMKDRRDDFLNKGKDEIRAIIEDYLN